MVNNTSNYCVTSSVGSALSSSLFCLFIREEKKSDILEEIKSVL